MGDALVMLTIPEEMIAPLQRRVWGEAPTPGIAEDPRVQITIDREAIWDLPPEPLSPGHGLEWDRDPALRKRHREAVRRSLETFINGNLEKLYFMVRSGRFVLGKARVRVVECNRVPEREMRQALRGLSRMATRKGPRKKRREGRGRDADK